MKKYIIVLLALTLCIFCAADEKQEPVTNEPSSVIDDLLKALDASPVRDEHYQTITISEEELMKLYNKIQDSLQLNDTIHSEETSTK